MLKDSDLDEARKARARNARRHAGLTMLDDSKPRSDGETRHFVLLNREQVMHLLVFGDVTVTRSGPNHPRWRNRCPWGTPGEKRWVHEPVIRHPKLGAIYVNNANWGEFRRKYRPEPSMPAELRRMVVRIISAERTGLSWQLKIQHVPR